MLGRDIRVQRSGVHADADGDSTVLGLSSDRLDLLWLAQVPWVQPKALDARLKRCVGHLLMKVNVGDDWDWRAGDDVRKTLRRCLLVAGAAHDVCSSCRQLVDLLESSLHVRRLRRGHRLDGNTGITADLHRADLDLSGWSARAQELLGGLHGPSLPCSSTRPSGTGSPPGGRCRDTSTSIPRPGGTPETRTPPASSS